MRKDWGAWHFSACNIENWDGPRDEAEQSHTRVVEVQAPTEIIGLILE